MPKMQKMLGHHNRTTPDEEHGEEEERVLEQIRSEGKECKSPGDAGDPRCRGSIDSMSGVPELNRFTPDPKAWLGGSLPGQDPLDHLWKRQEMRWRIKARSRERHPGPHLHQPAYVFASGSYLYSRSPPSGLSHLSVS